MKTWFSKHSLFNRKISVKTAFSTWASFVDLVRFAYAASKNIRCILIGLPWWQSTGSVECRKYVCFTYRHVPLIGTSFCVRALIQTFRRSKYTFIAIFIMGHISISHYHIMFQRILIILLEGRCIYIDYTWIHVAAEGIYWSDLEVCYLTIFKRYLKMTAGICFVQLVHDCYSTGELVSFNFFTCQFDSTPCDTFVMAAPNCENRAAHQLSRNNFDIAFEPLKHCIGP